MRIEVAHHTLANAVNNGKNDLPAFANDQSNYEYLDFAAGSGEPDSSTRQKLVASGCRAGGAHGSASPPVVVRWAC